MIDSFLTTISSMKRNRRGILNSVLSPLVISGLIIQINHLISSSSIYTEHVPPILDSMIKLRAIEGVNSTEETLIKLNRLSIIGFSLLITLLPLDFISGTVNSSKERESRENSSFSGKALAVLSPCLFSCLLGYLISAAFIKHTSAPIVFQSFVYLPMIGKVLSVSIILSVFTIFIGFKLRESNINMIFLKVLLVVFWNAFALVLG